MRELDALRRAGRAGRVDERQQVVGLDGRGRRLGVEVRVGIALDVVELQRALGRVVADDDDVLEVGQLGLTFRKRSANCASMTAIFAPASPTTYWICSGEAVT